MNTGMVRDRMNRQSRRTAALLLVVATLMWSIAGVVTRHIESARGFEVTFWRSAFAALTLLVLLAWLRGPRAVAAAIPAGGRTLWLSAACWCVMFTAFMLALTLTTVANVLVTIAVSPLVSALVARAWLGERLAPRTWIAIGLAGFGIAWMYGAGFAGSAAHHYLGIGIAFLVPIAFAINWNTLRKVARERGSDMLPTVLVGAILSALITFVPAMPFAASARDLSLLALLGAVQLAIPCLLAVVAARTLSAPEAALLGLLEVVFGVAWAWLGAGEAPSLHVLAGGLLVLLALAANEALALRSRR